MMDCRTTLGGLLKLILFENNNTILINYCIKQPSKSIIKLWLLSHHFISNVVLQNNTSNMDCDKPASLNLRMM